MNEQEPRQDFLETNAAPSWVTGYPSSIARSRSIELLRELLQDDIFEESEKAELQFAIETFEEDAKFEDEEVVNENTPLYWARHLVGLLKFEPDPSALLLTIADLRLHQPPEPFQPLPPTSQDEQAELVEQARRRTDPTRIERLGLVQDLLKDVSKWEFDVFQLANETNGWPLLHLGFALFHYYDLLNKFHIRPEILRNFLEGIEYGCNVNQNFYHNSLHVADCLQACHILLHEMKLYGNISDFDVLAVFMAVLFHDYRHPGFTNQYLIATQDELATLYNDVRVVENFACTAAFRLISEPDYDVFEAVSVTNRIRLRQQIIALVFATNLSDHFHFLQYVRSSLLADDNPASVISSIDFSRTDPRCDLLLKLLLKCADVSQAARPTQAYLRWSYLTSEEFFCQGDIEREQGMSISRFMDRNKPTPILCHQMFLSNIVLPIFASIAALVPSMWSAHSLVESHLAYWDHKKEEAGGREI